jgi:hypothetical protein
MLKSTEDGDVGGASAAGVGGAMGGADVVSVGAAGVDATGGGN